MRRFLLVVVFALAFAGPASAWTWPAGGPVLLAYSFDPAHPYAAGQHRGIDVGGVAGRVDPGTRGRRGHVRRHRARERQVGHDPHRRRLVGHAHPAGLDRRDEGRDGRRGRRRRDDRSERRPGGERALRAARDPACRPGPGLRRPDHDAAGPSGRPGAGDGRSRSGSGGSGARAPLRSRPARSSAPADRRLLRPLRLPPAPLAGSRSRVPLLRPSSSAPPSRPTRRRWRAARPRLRSRRRPCLRRRPVAAAAAPPPRRRARRRAPGRVAAGAAGLPRSAADRRPATSRRDRAPSGPAARRGREACGPGGCARAAAAACGACRLRLRRPCATAAAPPRTGPVAAGARTPRDRGRRSGCRPVAGDPRPASVRPRPVATAPAATSAAAAIGHRSVLRWLPAAVSMLVARRASAPPARGGRARHPFV